MVGDNVMEDLMVNVAVTLLTPPVSLISSVYGPAGNDGTINQVVRV